MIAPYSEDKRETINTTVLENYSSCNMDTFRFQDSDSDGPENGNIQDVKYNRHNATQTDLDKDQLCIREENAELISEIADLCNRPDRKDPEVLLLLGSVGVGKSSIVNTIIKALTGKYFHKAKTGRGNEAPTTLAFEWFENCGISKNELTGLQKEAFSNCLNKLPTIIDLPGMGVDDSAEVRELLEAMFEGFIPPEISAQSLKKLQTNYGVGCLKQIYPKSRKEWAVTTVVFVVSADQSPPTELVRLVRSLLESHDQATGYVKYNIDLFVVITKCDLVEGYSTSETTSTSNMIDAYTFKKINSKVSIEFCIYGSMEQSSIRWQSYVDGRCLVDPYIDNIALKFVRQMMLPKRRRHQAETDKVPLRIPLKMRLSKLIKKVENGLMDMSDCQRTAFILVTFCVFVFIIVPLMFLLLLHMDSLLANSPR